MQIGCLLKRLKEFWHHLVKASPFILSFSFSFSLSLSGVFFLLLATFSFFFLCSFPNLLFSYYNFLCIQMRRYILILKFTFSLGRLSHFKVFVLIFFSFFPYSFLFPISQFNLFILFLFLFFSSGLILQMFAVFFLFFILKAFSVLSYSFLTVLFLLFVLFVLSYLFALFLII